MAGESNNITPTGNLSIEAKLEGLLFVSPSPVTSHQLANALGISRRDVEKALQNLQNELLTRGIRIQMLRGRFQLTSAPEIAVSIEAFLNLEATSRLSQASLETLAIIAYQQPVTRPQVDSIRGVNSDSVLKGLLSKGLVEEAGRSEGPGRPILYGTTTEFLQHFGLSSLIELPPLDLPDAPLVAGGFDQPELPLKD